MAKQTFFMVRHDRYSKWQLVVAGSLTKARAIYVQRLGRPVEWPSSSTRINSEAIPLTSANWNEAKSLQALDILDVEMYHFAV